MANSNPGFVKDQKPTAAEWNSYFTAKVDAFEGIMTAGTIVGSSIDGSVIGGSTAAAASFTEVVINATGGTVVPAAPADTMLHLVGNTAKGRIFLDTFGQVNIGGRRANGIPGAPSALTADEPILVFSAGGYGATGYGSSSRVNMTFRTGEDWTDAHQGAGVDWSVTENGGTVSSVVMAIQNDGIVLIGTNAAIGASGTDNLQVDGGLSVDTVHISNSGTFRVTSGTNPLLVSANPGVPAASSLGTVLEVVGGDGQNARLEITGYGGIPNFVGRRAQGTQAAPTAVQATNGLTALSAAGYGTTGFGFIVRYVNVIAAENWTDTAQGAMMDFNATPTGSTTTTLAMRLQPSGIVTVGTTAVSGTNKLQVTGGVLTDFLNIGTVSGAPIVISGTGVPTLTAAAGSSWIRTDGSAGARWYINQNGTSSWAAIPSV